jgi:hypothetical protein
MLPKVRNIFVLSTHQEYSGELHFNTLKHLKIDVTSQALRTNARLSLLDSPMLSVLMFSYKWRKKPKFAAFGIKGL